MMRLYLEGAGCTCVVYETGTSLIRDLKAGACHVLILDWELPDISGDQVLGWVRQHLGWELPVIFVTGRDATEDIVAMLEAGADDYMVKPVNFKELLARATALVRRIGDAQKSGQRLDVPPYSIDFSNRIISRLDAPIALTPKEFDLAGYLFRNIGTLVPRETLLRNIWGYGAEINTRTIDIHISRIRKKLALLKENGWRLTSIYHRGYRLDRV
jgi:DNA-binding response OmpR family regulator